MPLRFVILTLIGQFSQHAPNRLLENSTTKEDLVDTTHLGRDKYDEFSRISKCVTVNTGYIEIDFKGRCKHTSETLTGEKIVF